MSDHLFQMNRNELTEQEMKRRYEQFKQDMIAAQNAVYKLSDYFYGDGAKALGLETDSEERLKIAYQFLSYVESQGVYAFNTWLDNHKAQADE